MTERIGNRSYNYLIGFQIEEFNYNKLPTYRDVINLLMHKHLALKFTIRQSTVATIDELNGLWNKIGIPTVGERNSIRKFAKFYQEYILITKQKFNNNKSKDQTQKADNFVNQLNRLFDINDSEVSNVSNDLQLFLMECRQNDGTKCFPLIPQQNEKFVSQHQFGIQNRQEDIVEFNLSRTLSQLSMSSAGSSQSSNYPEKRTLSDYEDELPQAKKKCKADMMTEILVAALDRTKTSNRSAMHIISAVIVSLGLDVENYNLSYSSICNSRIKFRKTIAENLKDGIHKTAENLIVHWDGKLLPELSKLPMNQIERLPIVVSGINMEKLLGVPGLDEATGANQAEVVFEALNEWNVSENIVGMCFDTTSINTGDRNGACVLIENKLNKDLLHLACRHHIFEIVLKNVAGVAWPATKSPDVPIFARFRKEWEKIDKLKYDVGTEGDEIKDILNKNKSNLLSFIGDHLQKRSSRDDNFELLILSYIFLGGIPHGGVKFRAPGAVHHARWLSKALYSLKIYMFRKQFNISRSELPALREICVFIFLFYVQAWFVSPRAIEVPSHDLKFFQNLLKYKEINTKIADAALNKLSKHLWYLNESLTGLSLFDRTITTEEKLNVIDSIRTKKSTGSKSHRLTLEKGEFDLMSTKNISDFVSKESLSIFQKFKLPCGFLEKHPDSWKTEPENITCRKAFEQLKVVNDTAERCVALIEKFNEFGTSDEDQKQYLLLTVQQCRKRFPTCTKKKSVSMSKAFGYISLIGSYTSI